MTWNDYIQKSGIEEYAAYERAVSEGGALFLETPDPLPVEISYDRCPVHGFNFIAMPRNAGENYHGPLEKCPLRSCKFSG